MGFGKEYILVGNNLLVSLCWSFFLGGIEVRTGGCRGSGSCFLFFLSQATECFHFPGLVIEVGISSDCWLCCPCLSWYLLPESCSFTSIFFLPTGPFGIYCFLFALVNCWPFRFLFKICLYCGWLIIRQFNLLKYLCLAFVLG